MADDCGLEKSNPRGKNRRMKSARQFVIVLVTAPDLKTARALAKAALAARLIACANLLPKVESHYTWKGKTERSDEVLVILKTSLNLCMKLVKIYSMNTMNWQ